jgi:hypothetical protein
MGYFKFLIIMSLAISLILPFTAIAQFRDQNPNEETRDYLTTPQNLGLKSLGGLLDPSRMQMSNEMSMGYISTGGTSASRGLYMNHLSYQFSRPFSITTHLGYQFQPSGPAEWNPANNGQQFVGGADLNWQPWRNTQFRFSVYQGMYPSPVYGQGWGFNNDPMRYSNRFLGQP